MKIDRLIGILSILLQRDSVTAPELARRFEVSRRTISRDIDALCRAGIPIATRQGANGGISILENYRFDRTLLTREEMQDLLAGLRSLDSVSSTNRCGRLMEKLSAGSSGLLAGGQSVLIDLSAWYRNALAPKIEQIRAAIEQRLLLEFLYYGPGGESRRTIEPYYLLFRWGSWYVWGWCHTRQDYRLFKLNRIDRLRCPGGSFERRPAPLPDLRNERVFPGGIRVKALFEPGCKWRLVEEFGPGCFEEQPDGRLLFQQDYTNQEELLIWLMTFRDQALLLEPAPLREELRAALEAAAARYAP